MFYATLAHRRVVVGSSDQRRDVRTCANVAQPARQLGGRIYWNFFPSFTHPRVYMQEKRVKMQRVWGYG